LKNCRVIWFEDLHDILFEERRENMEGRIVGDNGGRIVGDTGKSKERPWQGTRVISQVLFSITHHIWCGTRHKENT